MSLKEVDEAVRNWQFCDERAQTPGFCRRSAIEMKKVAEEADRTPPHVKVEFVVWPGPSSNPAVHYALTAEEGNNVIVYNPVPAPRFPKYNGSRATAPGLIPQMKVAREVE